MAQKTIYLKIECDFTVKKDQGNSFYSLDGKKWLAIGSALHMSYTIPHFMGYRYGLLNYATQQTGGWVDFDYFRIADKISK